MFSQIEKTMRDFSIQGGVEKDEAEALRALYNLYRTPIVKPSSILVSVDMGELGSIIVRGVKECEVIELKMTERDYDYLSVKTSFTDRHLFTDYIETEPYNRQGGLYCDGANWNSLLLVKDTGKYREFYSHTPLSYNISFGLSGFFYNNYWKSVRFGISISEQQKDEFLRVLRTILNK